MVFAKSATYGVKDILLFLIHPVFDTPTSLIPFLYQNLIYHPILIYSVQRFLNDIFKINIPQIILSGIHLLIINLLFI